MNNLLSRKTTKILVYYFNGESTARTGELKRGLVKMGQSSRRVNTYFCMNNSNNGESCRFSQASVD